MDTHAHHLHKAPGQRFWHYVFEFLMLFLAVLCGFQAEYLLEHRIERDREKEFIELAVKEMKADLRQIRNFEQDSNRWKYQDTLALLLLGPNRSQQAIKKMYMIAGCIDIGWTVFFRQNTLSQLKNAGNLRLIKNKAVVDSLYVWDGSISYSMNILSELKQASYDNFRLSGKIFDYGIFIKNGQWKPVEEYPGKTQTFSLLSKDEKLIHELGNNISKQKWIVRSYRFAIYNHKILTTRLMEFFKKQYNIEDD